MKITKSAVMGICLSVGLLFSAQASATIIKKGSITVSHWNLVAQKPFGIFKVRCSYERNMYSYGIMYGKRSMTHYTYYLTGGCPEIIPSIDYPLQP